jgi:transposase
MEDILALYARPYNPLEPMVCYDERPCFLIGDSVCPLPMETGKPRRENYAYEKHGSCTVLGAIEPMTGRRLFHIESQRRKVEFARFMRALADNYPDAEVIHVVLDNLNTHDQSAFYEVFQAAEAQALAARFCFHFTPKSASWLNMIEIEFSALSRQCLNRRIPSFEQLKNEVEIWAGERDAKRIKIRWQFTKEAARSTFASHYERVNPVNKNP